MNIRTMSSYGATRNMLVGASFILAAGVHAATLDLAGVGRTVTDVSELAAYDGVTNSTGGDSAMLTFNVASDMSYAGTISGNVKVVKGGAGMLTFSADNSYSGGTEINGGKLRGTSDNPFGDDHANNPIFVNADLTDGRSTSTDTSTAVVFAKAGTLDKAGHVTYQTYGYPITCSSWSNHGGRPGGTGTGSGTLYNIALVEDYIKLTGDISGGDISIRCGAIGENWNANPLQKSGPAVSGNINASGGTLALSSRAAQFDLSGQVRVGAIYQPIASYYPTPAKLSNSGNEIGLYDCGRANSGGRVTAGAAGVMGGAVLISTTYNFNKSGNNNISQSFFLGDYNQTINYPTIDYVTPRTPGDSVGMVPSVHGITCDRTLTMKATATATNDWCFYSSSANASLVWDPQGGDYWLYNVSRAHAIGGAITVKRGGFAMDENCSFSNVTTIAVADGASFVNESVVDASLKSVARITLGCGAALSLANNPFSLPVSIEAAPGATLDIAGDVTASSVKVGDHYLSAKDFSAGTYKGLTISGAGTLYVSTCPGGEGTYTWIGGGADDNITTIGNWQNSAAPDFEDETPFLVFSGGTAAVLNRDVSVSGITFDGVSAFNLSASDGHVLSIGEGGISNAPAASASAVTVSSPVMPKIDQIWQMDTNVTFTLSGILKRYGTSTPTITVRQSSFADPTVTFIGAATAEEAGDFAGDVVFEETALADGKFGTAYVRASGYEPFGPGGTLKLRSQGVNHDALMVRRAILFLSNAVISKAVEYGAYYPAYYYAEDNTTNVLSGTFAPASRGNWGAFPPKFEVGANAVLRLCGDMDFGDRTNSGDADLSLSSSATVVADRPTGKVVFDGRIVKLPRGLNLANAVGLELNAPGNAITNMSLRNGDNATATVRFGAPYALSNGIATVSFPTWLSRSLDFDLNGTVQHIKDFAPNAAGSSGAGSCWISSSGGPGTLRVSQASDVEFDAYVATNVTIQMEGAATLAFTHATAFRAGSTLAAVNGTVAVSNVSALNEDVTLKLLGGTISIPAGQTARVGEVYYLDGNGRYKQLPRGVYGPGDSLIGSFFAPGSGSIRVKKGVGFGFVINFH